MNPTDVVHTENYVSTIQGHIRMAKETWEKLEAAENRLNNPTLSDLLDMRFRYMRRITRCLVRRFRNEMLGQ